MAYPDELYDNLKTGPLHGLLQMVSYWHVSKDDKGKVTTLMPELLDGSMLDRKVELAEFANLDPRFPEFFNTIPIYYDSIPGEKVTIALAGWFNGLLALPIAFIPYKNKIDSPASFMVGAIEPDYAQNDNGDLLVTATYFAPIPMPSGHYYASAVLSNTITLPAMWLREHCPDWRTRFDVAKAIDLSKYEIPQYVLGAGHPPAPSNNGANDTGNNTELPLDFE